MNLSKARMITAAALAIALSACSQQPAAISELRRFPIDDLSEMITRSGVSIDPDVSSDGHGSAMVTAEGLTTVRLYELGDLDIEDVRLLYQAKLRTEDLLGRAYLEMWCHFANSGEYFSRDLETPVSGSTEWTTEETFFFLQRGQNPDNVKINLVIEGTGKVWIDDIRVLVAPLG